MQQQQGLADTLNTTNLKLYRDLQPQENSSQWDGTQFLHTPDSQNSKEGTRRIITRNDWTTPHTSDRPIQSSSRQQSVDNSPSLRDSARTTEDRYPAKRAREYSPEHRHDPLYHFDQVYGGQLHDSVTRTERGSFNRFLWPPFPIGSLFLSCCAD